jgi:hypothetical protein
MIRALRRRWHTRTGDQPPAPGSEFVPERVEVAARYLTADGEHIAALAVAGYPRQVHAGWLDPLAGYPGRLDVSVHVEPVDPTIAAERLRRRLARLEAGRRHGATHGQLADPEVDAAAGDAQDLADRLARGESRLFRVGLYLVVYAPDEAALTEAVAAVRALAASMLLDARPASYRQVAGWTTCLPIGIDALRVHRVMDTEAIAASFPFTSPDPPPLDPAAAALAPGIVYGLNLGSSGLVTVDRWAQPNLNMIVLGSSGAGKSYLVKIDLLRSLYAGVQGLVVDPEGEYVALTEAVGGTVVQLGQPGVHLNPLDLPTDPYGRPAPDAYVEACLFAQTVVAVLIGDPNPDERSVLDAAITATYAGAGITDDLRTWVRPAPLLAHLAATLADPTGPAGQVGVGLAGKLHPYVSGAYSGLLAGPTTVAPHGHLVTFDLRALPEPTQALGTLLALDAIWRQISQPAPTDPTGRPRPRIVVVDEAWTLLQTRAGARFLARMARSSRRHLAGLTIATQDAADVLGSELGRAVVHNAATQILLRQSTQVIDNVVRTFDLSHGERDFLLRAGQGQGLVVTAGRRMAVQTVASPGTEHSLITTDLRDQHTDHTGPDDPTEHAQRGPRW